jgi:hypothetical protein
MAALSWEEIVERAKQHNKTVICQVEKRGEKRCFKVKCNICEFENEKTVSDFDECKNCSIEANRLDTGRFIIKARNIHGDKYNYDLVEYVGTRNKVTILCNICNCLFEQTPNSHLSRQGCSSCGIRTATNKIIKSKEDFLIRAKNVHGDKYNYDLVEYINRSTKIKILCNMCNSIFEQVPSRHLYGDGCRKCGYILLQNKFKSNRDEFVYKAKNIHGDKYNYDLVEYINNNTKVKILCNICNCLFEQMPRSHLKGDGCKLCSYDKRRGSTEEFIIKAKNTHGVKYNYDLVEYHNRKTKVKIKCNKCTQIFEQLPFIHLLGSGCPKCNESKGEIKVTQYLSENNISFTPQKDFKSLRNINLLKYDFYLVNFNLLIEYDGEGHYFPCFGSTLEEKEKNFKNTQRRDKIKNEWAKANNIPLLRIPYWDFDRIEELIEAFIIEHTKKKELNQSVSEM